MKKLGHPSIMTAMAAPVTRGFPRGLLGEPGKRILVNGRMFALSMTRPDPVSLAVMIFQPKGVL
jgi:hypothetical protein